jgi:hypothetical protein
LTPESSLDGLRVRSSALARATGALFWLASACVVVPTFIGLAVAVSRGFTLAPIFSRMLAVWSPGAAYLYAIWALHCGLRDFGKEAGLACSLARACRRAGSSLAIGAVLSAVASPLATGLLAGRFSVQANLGSFVRPDLAYFALAIVGVSLVLIGHLLAVADTYRVRAAALEEELQEFF